MYIHMCTSTCVHLYVYIYLHIRYIDTLSVSSPEVVRRGLDVGTYSFLAMSEGLDSAVP